MLGDWDWGYYVNYYELWSREDPDLDYIHIWTKWGLRTRQIDDVLSQVLPDGECLGFHLLEDPKVFSRGSLRPGSCHCVSFSTLTILLSLWQTAGMSLFVVSTTSI